ENLASPKRLCEGAWNAFRYIPEHLRGSCITDHLIYWSDSVDVIVQERIGPAQFHLALTHFVAAFAEGVSAHVAIGTMWCFTQQHMATLVGWLPFHFSQSVGGPQAHVHLTHMGQTILC